MVNKPYRISASLGSVILNVDGDTTLYNVIKSADNRMYEVKRNKKLARSGSGHN